MDYRKMSDEYINRFGNPRMAYVTEEELSQWIFFALSLYDRQRVDKPSPNKDWLCDFANTVHRLAWDKGCHGEDETEDHFIERLCNNLHNEVSDLHEAWRNNKLHSPCDKADKMIDGFINPLTCLEEELADIFIHLLDGCMKLGVDIRSAAASKHAYNSHREYRHGGKRS